MLVLALGVGADRPDLALHILELEAAELADWNLEVKCKGAL
jgi:hypothetical protein